MFLLTRNGRGRWRRLDIRRRFVVWLSRKGWLRLALTACLVALTAFVFSAEIPSSKTWTYWSLPLSGKMIALDAGHGGADGGAVSREGTIEKDLNLAIVLYLRDYLQQAGALVTLTREGDYDLADQGTKGYSRRKTQDLLEREARVKGKKADLAISVHMNSIPSPKWSGAQTFFYSKNPEGKRLAGDIQREMVTVLENTDRVAKSNDTVYLLKSLDIPTALVEVGFLSHPEEARLLADEAYQKKVAAAIYRGILRYASGKSDEP
ncbi:N-acetylmuramoyl-L-alanine amidase CwlD [Cohnella caldifontis]|uniref:N-acetylmuramoyl-L-alanine amidase CwlD n=1 Tax=Cohnella caldifontis TaxID=3027471 RepID=UPI0023EA936C|nr:N-acetylmuramoyl-L-alanine amidase CwlD [Cohnella sp. YIM B05605]